MHSYSSYFRKKELHSFSFFLLKNNFFAYNSNLGEFSIFLPGMVADCII